MSSLEKELTNDQMIKILQEQSKERTEILKRIMEKEGLVKKIAFPDKPDKPDSDIYKLAQATLEINMMLSGILPDLIEDKLHLMHLEAQIQSLRTILLKKEMIDNDETVKEFQQALTEIIAHFKKSVEAGKSEQQKEPQEPTQ